MYSNVHTHTHIRVYACVSVCLYLKMYYKCVNETTTTIQFSTSIFRPIFALVNGFALSLLLATPVCSYLTKFCISFSIFNAANRLHMHTHIHIYIRSRSACSLALPLSLLSLLLGHPVNFLPVQQVERAYACAHTNTSILIHTHVHIYTHVFVSRAQTLILTTFFGCGRHFFVSALSLRFCFVDLFFN